MMTWGYVYDYVYYDHYDQSQYGFYAIIRSLLLVLCDSIWVYEVWVWLYHLSVCQLSLCLCGNTNINKKYYSNTNSNTIVWTGIQADQRIGRFFNVRTSVRGNVVL